MPESIKNHVWKKVAITGAAGNIGGAVARRLHELGYSLVLIDKKPAADPVAPFIETDLRNRDAVRRALDGVDAVCHLGEVPNILKGMTGDEVFDTNTMICRTMLDVSRDIGVRRFIYTSSCQYYGYWGAPTFPAERLPDCWPLDERQPPCPPNRYAESKVVNEEQCEAASGAMQVFRFRFPWVMPMRASDRANRLYLQADDHLHEGFWTYLDLRDAAEAYVCGLNPTGVDRSKISTCEAFHFVADEVMGPAPIRAKMAKFLKNWPVIPSNWGTHQPPVLCEKAERFLGWRARYRMSQVISDSSKQTAEQSVVTD